jgi:ubiquinone biosynthesis protein
MWAQKAPPLLFGQVSIFGVLGFAASTVLSFRLFRAINHSGRLEE